MIDKTKLLFTALVVVGVTTGTWALIGGGYDLTWNTIDGGGGLFSTGGGFDLSGTIGQPDAGSMSGGTFTLDGGFWPGIAGVSIAQWRSVRTHGGAGAQSITLDATATGNGLTGPTVECRSGGIQRIEIDFSSAITLATTSAITVVGRSTSYPGGVLGGPVSYTPSSVTLSGAATMVLTFPASPGVGFLPDQTCYTITIPQATIVQTLLNDNDANVRALVGDATGSGDVNLSDVILAKLRIGAAITANARFDMDLSGAINISDAEFAKAHVTSPGRKALCP